MSDDKAKPPSPIRDLAGVELPRDEAGPVFSEPWQARIFGLVVHLCEARGIPWKEWADHFGRELAEAAAPDSGRDPGAYYERWLSAAESFLAERDLVDSETRARVKDEILAQQIADRHSHDH